MSIKIYPGSRWRLQMARFSRPTVENLKKFNILSQKKEKLKVSTIEKQEVEDLALMLE